MEYFVIIFICPVIFFLVALLYLTFVSYFSFSIPVGFLYRYCAGLLCSLFIYKGSKVFLGQVLTENSHGIGTIFQATWDFLTIRELVGSLYRNYFSQPWHCLWCEFSLLLCWYRDSFLKILLVCVIIFLAPPLFTSSPSVYNTILLLKTKALAIRTQVIFLSFKKLFIFYFFPETYCHDFLYLILPSCDLALFPCVNSPQTYPVFLETFMFPFLPKMEF